MSQDTGIRTTPLCALLCCQWSFNIWVRWDRRNDPYQTLSRAIGAAALPLLAVLPMAAHVTSFKEIRDALHGHGTSNFLDW